MANSQTGSKAPVSTPAHPSVTPNPLKNPAYPQRIHIGERAHWQGILASCDSRIATAKQTLTDLTNSPSKAALERLYAQMLGARDQVYESARRLPGETGELYEEDKHRLEEAVLALDRVFIRWDAKKV